MVDEQYGYGVIGCYGSERVYCLAVLVVLCTPAGSSRFEPCQLPATVVALATKLGWR
jgi:hypothetical protein